MEVKNSRSELFRRVIQLAHMPVSPGIAPNRPRSPKRRPVPGCVLWPNFGLGAPKWPSRAMRRRAPFGAPRSDGGKSRWHGHMHEVFYTPDQLAECVFDLRCNPLISRNLPMVSDALRVGEIEMLKRISLSLSALSAHVFQLVGIPAPPRFIPTRAWNPKRWSVPRILFLG